MDWEGIEKSCIEKDKVCVPQKQVSLLKEAIFKSKASNRLGIISGSHKETKKKVEEQGRKTRQKYLKILHNWKAKNLKYLLKYKNIKKLFKTRPLNNLNNDI